jgi:type I restriction enzyme S subunit
LNSDFYVRYVLLIAFGGAQPNISDKQLLDCCVPVPPPREQDKIFSFLEIETSKLENLISQANSAIDRLTEYRQALITSAVTGKIDVRGLT